jgi:glycosyltransferase involved in cell wall biosynthesis
MVVSVVIPVKKNDETIQACLRAVCASSLADFELIVVLDGWESKSFILEWINDSRIQIVSLPKCGPAVCRNYGVKLSKGSWIAFVDSDVLIQEDSLEKALKRLQETAEDGLIGSYDSSPAASSHISKFRNILHHHHHQENDLRKGVFWGAFSLIKKRIFEDVGGFDEQFFLPSIEDVELGIRLSNCGYVIRIHADIQVKHLKKWTFYNWMITDIFLRAKPWTMLIFWYGKHAGNHLNTSSKEKVSAFFVLVTLVLLLNGLIWTWLWVLVPITIFIFILLQLAFYKIIIRYFGLSPTVLLLHHIYFIFAGIGFVLGALHFKSGEYRRHPFIKN